MPNKLDCTIGKPRERGNLPYGENPSCLHATLAALYGHISSQIVVHVKSVQYSKRPAKPLVNPLRRILPSSQGSEEEGVCMRIGGGVGGGEEEEEEKLQ